MRDVKPVRLSYSIVGSPATELVQWFIKGLHATMQAEGHVYHEAPNEETGLILNLVSDAKPRPFRRRSQGVFVVSILEGAPPERHILEAAYPHLLRNISNLVIYHTRIDGEMHSYFVTPEQGHPGIVYRNGAVGRYFEEAYRRVAPLACSRFVIDNYFTDDLPDDLAQGTRQTQQLFEAGRKLDALGLLPSVVKIEDFLSEDLMRQVWRLYRVGGLSYGNLSIRHDEKAFWMSASGVDKSNLRSVGKHIHLVTGYDPLRKAMCVSIPKNLQQPVRASVDAIEHWMIYGENPAVGAIIHAHCWVDPDATRQSGHTVAETTASYPCGTVELGCETASIVRSAADPARVVVCQKNHGIVATGRDLQDIFDRIDSGEIQIIQRVEMT